MSSRSSIQAGETSQQEQEVAAASNLPQGYQTRGVEDVETKIEESAGISFLVSNHGAFGLVGRVCYHFDLIEILRRSQGEEASTRDFSAATKTEDGGSSNPGDDSALRTEQLSKVVKLPSEKSPPDRCSFAPAASSFCGIAALLECVPQVPLYKQTKKSKKILRGRIREFNHQARRAREEEFSIAASQLHYGPRCHQPLSLPLRPRTTTRITFAYEITSMVICLDASSTLTSTFGNFGSHPDADGAVCALDRIGNMVRRYLTALVQPIPGASNVRVHGSRSSSDSHSRQKWWSPELRVTVLAVFPPSSVSDGDDGESMPTSLLVRDYRVDGPGTASALADAIDCWALDEIEGQIAQRLSRVGGRRNDRVEPMTTSSLATLLDIADDALSSTLPREGRPIVVLATDCRSVVCDSVLDTLSGTRRTDVPIHVLDLSAPHSHHSSFGSIAGGGVLTSASKEGKAMQPSDASLASFLTFDDDGPGSFPLSMSDDAESMYQICRASGGCFFDSFLLDEASKIVAGQVPTESDLYGDHYLTFRRRTLRPNAVQWYTIFILSPLTPTYNASWGRLPPPKFLQHKRGLMIKDNKEGGRHRIQREIGDTRAQQKDQLIARGNAYSRTVFSMYSLSPVRVKGVLLMRVIEGFRARRYGQNTHADDDKLSVAFSVPLEYGTVLHYELSYVASPIYNVLVGSAHVKVELSGDPGFIQAVKNDFISHHANLQQRARHGTIAQRVSEKLCRFMRWLRREDYVESYLCPVEWGEKLNVGSSFLRRLGTLTTQQRHRHFDVDSFEVVCVGGDPYSNHESLLGEFIEVDDGKSDLFEILSGWSTEIIAKEKCYVKKLPTQSHDLVTYCVVQVSRSREGPRLYDVSLEFYGCFDVSDRINITRPLKMRLSSCKSLVVVPRNISRHISKIFLTGSTSYLSRGFFHNAHWKLNKDDEIIPILCTRRRSSVGNFWLLSSSKDDAFLAKFVSRTDGKGQADSVSQYLVLYRIHAKHDHVSVDIWMEARRGHFYPFTYSARRKSVPAFYEIFERVRFRDQECALSLKRRRRLLNIFDFRESASLDEVTRANEQKEDVSHLLPYATSITKRLRFFGPGSGTANQELAEMTRKMILLSSAGTDISRLSIDAEASFGSKGEGTWFLINHDRHTLSIVHFSSQNKSQVSERTHNEGLDDIYRELVFHTVSVFDLYQLKDDFEEGGGEEVDVEEFAEHLGVSEIAEAIQRNHAKNYARAAYLALRNGGMDRKVSFQPQDFDFVIARCSEIKVSEVYLSSNNYLMETERHTKTGSALSALISKIFRPIPGGGAYLYYTGNDSNDIMGETHQTGSLDRIHDLIVPYVASAEFSIGEESTQQADEELSFSSEEEIDPDSIVLRDDSDSENSTEPLSHYLPPIFIRFFLDNEEATVDELQSFESGATLSACITTFHTYGGANQSSSHAPQLFSSRSLPKLHGAIALNLIEQLNSFVAEQTLERLRHVGSGISEIDLRTAVLSLLEAENVASTAIPLEFFVADSDHLVSAVAPTGNELALETIISTLCSEIEAIKTVKLRRITQGGGDFVVVSEGDSALPYWCFIQLQRGLGRILLNVHHPGGMDKAKDVADRTKAAIRQRCHRVNQLLLLENMHRTRNASYLMIKEENDPKEDIVTQEGYLKDQPKPHAGEFGCAVKFQTSFYLNHRVPRTQAVVALESKVLHNFSVSNRRGIFVYKDEEGQVFYMRLSSFSNTDGPDAILLLVHGVDNPGPSITEQLCRLLEKMLITIAIEALSSVLTKNPFFPLLPSDISFLHRFEAKLKEIEGDSSLPATGYDRTYVFPDFVNPMFVLLHFRQNICGSGFFHRLNEAGSEEKSILDDSASSSQRAASDSEISNKKSLRFDPGDFALFYNNSPSQVDPTYQPVSTLTKMGDTFRRKSGSGIALVEVKLLNPDRSPINSIQISEGNKLSDALPGHLDPPLHMLRFRPVEDDTSLSESSYLLSVKIVNTLLDVNILHSWVNLSLNQAAAGWVIEKQLTQARNVLIPPSLRNKASASPLHTALSSNPYSDAKEVEQASDAHHLHRRLHALRRIFVKTHTLPHPAVVRIELKKSLIKSKLLAPLTLDLIQLGFMEAIHPERKAGQNRLAVIRLSATKRVVGNPKLVTMVRRGAPNNKTSTLVVETGAEDGKKITDNPIESPEYLWSFGLDEEGLHGNTGDKKRRTSLASLLVFREVNVEQKSDQDKLAKSLAALKSTYPELFSRSLSVIMHVRRSSRVIYFYNWNKASLSKLVEKLEDIQKRVLLIDSRTSLSQQARCFRGFNVFNELTEKTSDYSRDRKDSSTRVSNASTTSAPSASVEQSHRQELVIEGRRPMAMSSSRKIRRPTKILKPTLVGKSVDGSAMQALAASRARARSGPAMPSQRKSVAGGRQGTRSQREKASFPAAKGVSKTPAKSIGPKPAAEKDEGTGKEAPKRHADSGARGQERQTLLNKKGLSIPTKLVASYRSVVALYPLSTLKRRIPTSASQVLVSKFLEYTSRQKGACTLDEIHFMLGQAIPFYSCSCEALQCGDGNIFPFLQSFAGSVVKRNRNAEIVATANQKENSLFVRQDLAGSRSFKAVLLIRLGFAKHRLTKQYIVRCSCWLFLSPTHKNSLGTQSSKDIMAARIKRRDNSKPLTRLERASLSLYNLAEYYCETLHLRSQYLNFVASLLHNGSSELDGDSTAKFLRMMKQKCPIHFQRQHPELSFRLIHDKIHVKTFTDVAKHVNFELSHLFGYICSHPPPRWHLMETSKNQNFLSGDITSGEAPARFFLTLDEYRAEELRCFVLFHGDSTHLDGYVFTPGQLYAERLSTKIFRTIALSIIQTVRTSAINLRRDTLWANHSLTQNFDSSLIRSEEIYEMCLLSSSTSLIAIDPRLASLLSGGSDLRINWSSAFFSMQQDPMFSHRLTFEVPGTTNKGYIFYFARGDKFLLFELSDAHGDILVANLLLREEVLDEETLAKKHKAVEGVVNWLLHWIWYNI